MTFREAFVRAACLVGLLFPAVATSQSTQQIDASTTSCPGCSINLVKIATLGSADDDVLPAVSSTFVPSTNSRGEFFVPSLGVDQVVVYDRSGKFLRTIGRKGEGPGEYLAIFATATGPNDSLFVLASGRLSVYANSFVLVRTVPVSFGAFGAFVVFPNGDFVVDAGSTNTSPQPLRLLSVRGKATPVGPAVNVPAAPCLPCGAYSVSRAASPGQFWSAGPNTYLIERHSANGEVLQEIQMTNSSWFRAWARTRTSNRQLPPKTTLRSLREDSQGRLWVLGDGPSPTWHPTLFPGEMANTKGRVGLKVPPGGEVAEKQVLETIATNIDVIDPITARLVVHTTFTGRRLKQIAAGIFVEARESASGVGVLDVFRAVIKKP